MVNFWMANPTLSPLQTVYHWANEMDSIFHCFRYLTMTFIWLYVDIIVPSFVKDFRKFVEAADYDYLGYWSCNSINIFP